MSGELVAALAKAQSKFGAIGKSHTADTGKFAYQYADLADILAAVRPHLAAEGLLFIQRTKLTDAGTVLVSEVRLGDDVLDSEFLLPLERADAQAVGSLMSYHRRYQACALLGVQPEREDDDGQAAKGIKHERRTPPRNVDRETGEVRSRAPSPKILGARMNSHGFDATKKTHFVSAVVGEPRKLDDCTADELGNVAAELDRVDAGELPTFTPAGCVLASQAGSEPF